MLMSIRMAMFVSTRWPNESFPKFLLVTFSLVQKV